MRPPGGHGIPLTDDVPAPSLVLQGMEGDGTKGKLPGIAKELAPGCVLKSFQTGIHG